MESIKDFTMAALPWIILGLCTVIVLVLSENRKKAAKVSEENNEIAEAGKDNDSKKEKYDNYGALGMCMGMSFGLLLGNLTDNPTLMMSLGMIFGLAVGMSIKKKKEEE